MRMNKYYNKPINVGLNSGVWWLAGFLGVDSYHLKLAFSRLQFMEFTMFVFVLTSMKKLATKSGTQETRQSL